jgi:signal transduction histidine kinase
MQRLVNDLLSYARVSYEPQSFQRVNLNDVVKEVLLALALQIREQQAQVQCGPLPELEADPSMMHQLFQNLISNAIKFRQADSVPVVSISAASDDQTVCICIEDNGVGFNIEEADRIFGVFERLQTASTIPGSGIGLAVCQKIVSRHHGRSIQVESQLNQGSVFRVTLPLRQPRLKMNEGLFQGDC